LVVDEVIALKNAENALKMPKMMVKMGKITLKHNDNINRCGKIGF